MSKNNYAPEMDALRQGMDWDFEDVSRKQILIERQCGKSCVNRIKTFLFGKN
jgi:hypothetical protein